MVRTFPGCRLVERPRRSDAGWRRRFSDTGEGNRPNAGPAEPFPFLLRSLSRGLRRDRRGRKRPLPDLTHPGRAHGGVKGGESEAVGPKGGIPFRPRRRGTRKGDPFRFRWRIRAWGPVRPSAAARSSSLLPARARGVRGLRRSSPTARLAWPRRGGARAIRPIHRLGAGRTFLRAGRENRVTGSAPGRRPGSWEAWVPSRVGKVSPESRGTR